MELIYYTKLKKIVSNLKQGRKIYENRLEKFINYWKQDVEKLINKKEDVLKSCDVLSFIIWEEYCAIAKDSLIIISELEKYLISKDINILDNCLDMTEKVSEKNDELQQKINKDIELLKGKTENDATLKEILCINCGRANAPQNKTCEYCGIAMVAHTNKGQTDEKLKSINNYSKLLLLIKDIKTGHNRTGELLRYLEVFKELLNQTNSYFSDYKKGVPENHIFPEVKTSIDNLTQNLSSYIGNLDFYIQNLKSDNKDVIEQLEKNTETVYENLESIEHDFHIMKQAMEEQMNL